MNSSLIPSYGLISIKCYLVAATEGTMKGCLDMVSEDIVDTTHSSDGMIVGQEIIDLSLHNRYGVKRYGVRRYCWYYTFVRMMMVVDVQFNLHGVMMEQ